MEMILYLILFLFYIIEFDVFSQCNFFIIVVVVVVVLVVVLVVVVVVTLLVCRFLLARMISLIGDT